jgi:predicted GIY-YIG superfamily endonuclease
MPARTFSHFENIVPERIAQFRFEETRDIHAALTREKQVKGWTRARKLELIAKDNPKWVDLSADWTIS